MLLRGEYLLKADLLVFQCLIPDLLLHYVILRPPPPPSAVSVDTGRALPSMVSSGENVHQQTPFSKIKLLEGPQKCMADLSGPGTPSGLWA